ncbi:DUF4279 domain-containing protein [Frankia sp. CNm7]|uniref:DUF4279 domain-containing protein n=1 Tax=Frankia nepalensis TaxID=1836974 RepID=A0A937RC36_9ACTN|nr:DUF4279 domain-containing protein [Frankia nepalensis]MBL7496559.1 DUF4279 domain-containing protein [Frankia nepalensis]MBL7508778.1 DUF4279 domain-containing protein [Frankia nepalensis]MBL7520595.1 DUF4279 domain-containing protein [Frankia nepalensis]MBL7627532.1 DUF4279 domain-containing protein [Frankia nepalensis]
MRDETALTARCTQRAYLYLERDHDPAGPPYSDRDRDQMAFDPDEVTSLVGLTPTEAWRRGDPAARAGRPPRRFSNWKYGLPEVRTFDTEEVVTALLDAIEPHATGITNAYRALGMRGGVMVVIWMHGVRNADGDVAVSTPALSYSRQTVQRLAQLQLAVHHDQYIELPDP